MILRSTAAVLLSWLISPASVSNAVAAEPGFTSPTAQLMIDPRGGLPVEWLACRPDCQADSPRQVLLDRPGSNLRLEWSGDPALVQVMTDTVYQVRQTGNDLFLISLTPVAGRQREHRYSWLPEQGRLQAELDLPPGIGLQLRAGPDFAPEALPGFGSIYGNVRPLRVSSARQVWLDEPDEDVDLTLDAAAWAGIRQRFWTVLLRAPDGARLSIATTAENQPALTFAFNADGPVRIDLLAGPVDRAWLRDNDPVLGEMLFAALWDWLRALSTGMLLLLAWLQNLVGNPGIAIMLLSLCVKILMYPLTWVADRWQADVHRIQALLQPELDAIKRDYKGEEAHNRVLAVYEKHDVSPWFTLKSAAGFLIQIPVFIAAFDMLGENFALNQAQFMWIEDLSKPDRLAALPFTLPFFGGWLNLMPFVMTGLTLAASTLQADPALPHALRRQQRTRLFLMAAAFFLLFYTFPAGMVLYWATNNLLHLLKILPASLRARTAAIN